MPTDHSTSRRDRFVMRTDDTEHPERGVPYSVSWFVDDGAMMRADRVYVIERLVDPSGWRLLDRFSGKELLIMREAMPLFRAPTKPHPAREALAKQWGRPVSPVRVHGIERVE